MLARRRFLALLGLAPIAAPVAAMSGSAPPIITAGADVTAHGIAVAPRVWLDAHFVPDPASIRELVHRLRWGRIRRDPGTEAA